MLLNPRYVPLLLQNWSEVNRCAHRLNSSLVRLQADFPLTGERLTTDDESLFERLDAFRVRYADLQDAIGNKLFRSILLVLDEKSINMAETLSKMEKFGVLSSVDEWRLMREIRNSFSPEYSDAEQERALMFNRAWETAPALLSVVLAADKYLQQLGVFTGGSQ